VFRWYSGILENTARAFRDGWMHTGDLRSADAHDHGTPRRRGVVPGVRDPIGTEEVYPTILVREGCSFTEAEVVEWCAARLWEWKVPRYIRAPLRRRPRLRPNGLARHCERGKRDLIDRRREPAAHVRGVVVGCHDIRARGPRALRPGAAAAELADQRAVEPRGRAGPPSSAVNGTGAVRRHAAVSALAAVVVVLVGRDFAQLA
jgi:hypothetical protein